MKLKKSISVEFWNKVFIVLKCLSLFSLLRWIFRKKNSNWWYNFVDIWVLSHLFLSVTAIFIVKQFQIQWIQYLIVVYGFLRVSEIIFYQINVLLFDEYRHKKKSKEEFKLRSYRRMIINLLCNFWEIIFWFSSSYAVFSNLFYVTDMSIPKLIFNSFAIMTTFGVTDLKIQNDYGLYILWFQSLSGLFMTLLSITRFIGLLPKMETMDEYEQ